MRGDLEWGTIPRMVRLAAERYSDLEAVVDGDVRLTFAQLGEAVEVSTRAAMAAGIEPGDRVAIWAPNIYEWIVAALGLLSAGAVLVPLNTRFKGHEAAYILGQEPGSDPLLRQRLPRQRLREPPRCVACRSARARDHRRPAGRGPGRRGGLVQLSGRGVGRHGRRRPEAGRVGARRRPVRHHLHIGDHGAAEGSDVHPRPDPAGLRRLGRDRRADGG